MTFGGAFVGAYKGQKRNPVNVPDGWWNLYGAIPRGHCVAAYQPKGAASLAASYVNLANPGTYDAAPGSAPAWDATNGWKSDGTKYLTTGITPTANTTVVVRFSNYSGTAAIERFIVGQTPTTTTATFAINIHRGATNMRFYYSLGTTNITPNIGAGVVALASNKIYVDGVSAGTVTGTYSGTPYADMPIMARWNAIAYEPFGAVVYVQAVAFYNNDQSANMAALYTAIAAL